MKRILIVAALWVAAMGSGFSQEPAKTFAIDDGFSPWWDQPDWKLDRTPWNLKEKNTPVPQQEFGAHSLIVPASTKAILIGVAEKDVSAFSTLNYQTRKTEDRFLVKDASGNSIPYVNLFLSNPPEKITGDLTCGLILMMANPPPIPDPFPVGEKKDLHLYIMIGQSNMLGRDKTGLGDQIPNPMIGAMNMKGEWFVAVDPIPGTTGTGPGIAFAEEMRKSDPAMRIGLVQCAVGGSPLSRWIKGGELYEKALIRARQAAQSGTIDGILWHQGESDTNDEELAKTYEVRLAQMLKDFRTDLGMPNVPIVVGQLGEFVKGKHIDLVRAGIQNIPNDVPMVGYADSAGLGHKGDSLHFNSEGQHQMGIRYATAMKTLVKEKDSGQNVMPPAQP